jgi:hypothetical protein
MAVEQVLYKDYLISIDNDYEPLDPRQWDNFGTMVCFHNKYTLGDKHDIESPDFSSWSEVHDYIEADLGGMVILPLYLYDHSGISMRVGGFRGIAQHAGWDSGQVGFIYCTDGDMVAEGITDLAQAEALLRGEVEAYDRYLTGQVYTYRIEKSSTCESCNHTSAEFVDSCSGWDTIDDAMKEAMQVVDYQASKVNA